MVTAIIASTCASVNLTPSHERHVKKQSLAFSHPAFLSCFPAKNLHSGGKIITMELVCVCKLRVELSRWHCLDRMIHLNFGVGWSHSRTCPPRNTRRCCASAKPPGGKWERHHQRPLYRRGSRWGIKGLAGWATSEAKKASRKRQ